MLPIAVLGLSQRVNEWLLSIVFPITEIATRYQGRIVVWKDDQGFGYIAPNGGGAQVFVHITAFSDRTKRPVGNETVTYELAHDRRGRVRAENVAFAGDRSWLGAAQVLEMVAMAPAILLIVVVVVLVLAGKLPALVLGLYLCASVVAVLIYAKDKAAARNNRWRTPEGTLLTLGLIGGWPGALIAQRLLHHKSRKLSFQIAFWASVIANLGALGWLLTPQGTSAMRSILAWQ